MEDRLQKFAQVIEAGSFTAAARNLHISQPALTLAVNKLERELRTPLLLPNRKQLELTEAGRLAYATAKAYRTTGENLRTRLTELARERPKVSVGMIDSVAAALNGEAGPLESIEARADVSIIVNNSRYLRAAVESREIDLAFAIRDTTPSSGLKEELIGEELFTLVCRPDRLDAIQTELNDRKLLNFISYDKQSTTYGHLDAGLRKLKIATNPVLYSTNPSIMMHTALRGRGVAALPCLLTKELVDSGQLAVLKKDGRVIRMSCPIAAVRRRGQVLPEATESFLAQAKSTLEAANRTLI